MNIGGPDKMDRKKINTIAYGQLTMLRKGNDTRFYDRNLLIFVCRYEILKWY